MFFRPNVLLSAASRVATATTTQQHALRTVLRATPVLTTRFYSVSRDNVESRVLDIVKGFQKVDDTKVTLSSHFIKDLGLDSLDTVEVVMAIEEEFSVEIPDKDADAIKTVQEAVDYIAKRDDAQ
ncbi:NADH dehydrogenase 1, alpha/beta subcomplex subunit 1 NDUFAB1/ACP [Phycomyces blakesleeanus]|uniref:Acyl carrier protein n=2 Tax=Phycomyces blakesleeanus TaxID=4837 RepID=A0A162TCT3_PHYB8|nr:NADH dehydrogenase 1, alpha/beta subcomplex subunit 1 NDUFAB1/ACP [Phycomyces blakesleeanus NRRL 1555(-)]OAD67572.1 NADH dehydrogenase 1, alpha/beta subcomplex subunit 1 NDUFAB1/ACP [Phycomyces blakesleeanus NRRL 1555(-)]|eukprot:XP_018285612.1 NADH dehydrogenase 1, alpha/beta subcomplex subunit 1 NDUFAB1/ACP [Phycomyces blakesleeanus NRRL 1555(-)]